MGSAMTAECLVRLRRQAERVRPGEREDGTLDRCPRACGNGLRRPAPFSDLRRSHPKDRSDDRPRTRHHPGARRRRLRAGLGRRHALGRTVSRPQDPSGRSARPAQSFAPSSPTASSPASPGWTASFGTAPGKRRERTAAHRSADRRGSGTARHAARRGRVGPRVQRRRQFFCGGGSSGKVRAVRRPRQN